MVPGPASRKFAVVMEKGSIGSLKVTLTVLLSGTAVAPQLGLVKITVGGVLSGAGPVVKVHVKSLNIALPARSLTPVVAVIWYTVLGVRALVGVNVATVTLPLGALTTAPPMGVIPGGTVRVKVLVERVEVSIASLKITATLVLSTTSVAPQLGLVASTKGGVVSGVIPVVKPQEKPGRAMALPPVSLTPAAPPSTVTVIRVVGGRVTVGVNFT